jgi:transcription elongation factor Elf1
MAHTPVSRPPACPDCGHPELKPLDHFVVTFVYKCPNCKRGYQAERPKSVGWEKVEAYFDYENAPFPEYEELYDAT